MAVPSSSAALGAATGLVLHRTSGPNAAFGPIRWAVVMDLSWGGPSDPGTGVYRSRRVLWGGSTWLLAGLIAWAFVPYAQDRSRSANTADWLTAILVIGGGFLVVAGSGLLASRMELREHEVVSYWIFSKAVYRLADLSGATLTEPDTHKLSKTSDPFVLGPGLWIWMSGLFIRFVEGLLELAFVPASGGDQVLHLIRRYGGVVKIPAITTVARDRYPTRTAAALRAVERAIEREQALVRPTRGGNGDPAAPDAPWAAALPPFPWGPQSP